MSLHPKVQEELLDRGYSRRSIARIALGARQPLPFFHEFAWPAGRRPRRGRAGGGGARATTDPDTIRISGNENPMGPSKEGLESIAQVAPKAWRYGPVGDNQELQALIESTEGLKSGYATLYPGSGPALSNLVPAFTSPTRSWVMAIPATGAARARTSATKW